jgi:hypothetical protein
MQPRTLRRAPTPLPSDELVAPRRKRPHNHWLNHPASRNGAGQFFERVLIKMATRLIGMGLNLSNRQHRHARNARRQSISRSSNRNP